MAQPGLKPKKSPTQQRAPQQFQGSQFAQPQGDVFPPTMGPGFPDVLQPFPQDFAALQQTMQQGYAPGSDPASFAAAQNAHALARSQEQMAMQQAQDAEEDVLDQQALAQILQRQMARRGVTGAGVGPAPASAPSPQR